MCLNACAERAGQEEDRGRQRGFGRDMVAVALRCRAGMPRERYLGVYRALGHNETTVGGVNAVSGTCLNGRACTSRYVTYLSEDETDVAVCMHAR